MSQIPQLESSQGLKFKMLSWVEPGQALILDLPSGVEWHWQPSEAHRADLERDPPQSCYFLSLAQVDAKGWVQAHADSVLIYEPDYLVDVTEIAQCFGKGGRPDFADLPPDPEQQLFKLFSVRGESRVSTLLGTLLGNCMDEVLEQLQYQSKDLQQIDLEALMRKCLRGDLLRLGGVREMSLAAVGKTLLEGWIDKPGSRFQSLKPGLRAQLQIVVDLLGQLGPGQFFWEVPLVSHEYGLSGRTDVQFVSPSGQHSVIELKSSVSNYEPREEHYVSPDHRAQIHLYDLIHESLAHQGFDQRFAWYTGKNFAPQRPVEPLDSRARRPLLEVRNGIARRALQLIEPQGVIQNWRELVLHKERIPAYNNEAKAFAYALEGLLAGGGLDLEYAAFISALIARENVASQMDLCGHERSQPASQLWALSALQKAENQNLLYELKVHQRQGRILQLQGAAGQSSRFRRGDRLLLYTQQGDLQQAQAPRAFLKVQFLGFKANSQIQAQLGVHPLCMEIQVQGYSPEMEEALAKDQNWILEYDSLGSKISLAQVALFLQRMPLHQKDLWLGRGKPRFADYEPREEQDQRQSIARRAAYAEDLFLIQGPPGCGKTSHLIPALLEQSFARAHAQGKPYTVLILSFTNQATYAICRSLARQKQSLNFDFLHLGRSPVELGMEADHPWYKQHNFNTLLAEDSQVLRSSTLADRLQNCSVLVSTLASAGENVLRLKSFDLLILDEASQVHESAILSHLSFVPKWILIGDHKQLPPVIGQNEDLPVPPALLNLGYAAQNEEGQWQGRPLASVMERLWRLCRERLHSGAWPDCTAMVETQYRMHPDLQEFPSQRFYGAKLRAGLKDFTPLSKLYRLHPDHAVQWHSQRVFAVDLQGFSKENRALQTQAVLKWILKFMQLAEPTLSLGLIMPYRVDLAAVNQALIQAGLWEELEMRHAFKMDTVERFQGDEKDVILFVPGLYHSSQWGSLQSLLPADPTSGDAEVDTRLNVAWTRARAQLILMGNLHLLAQSSHYAQALASLPESARLIYRAGDFWPEQRQSEEITPW